MDRRQEAAMKDIRCTLGLHKWKKQQIENSQFVACQRCGKDRTIYVQGMPFS
jgi:hypothetical protein